jgi:hypothetical protein
MAPGKRAIPAWLLGKEPFLHGSREKSHSCMAPRKEVMHEWLLEKEPFMHGFQKKSHSCMEPCDSTNL